MSDVLVRCTSCRGTKKLAKLGGVIGDCNLCDGTGKIKESEKPVMTQSVNLEHVHTSSVIAAVAKAVPFKTALEHPEIAEALGKKMTQAVEHKFQTPKEPERAAVKEFVGDDSMPRKRAVFKRKKEG